MPEIKLRNPTGRNTPAHIITIGEHDFYFSYETCIAYRGPLVHCRIPNLWGPTTGRHIREMGVYNWPEVDADKFWEALYHFGDPQVSFASRLLSLVAMTRNLEEANETA
jgi:hypothetical protein